MRIRRRPSRIVTFDTARRAPSCVVEAAVLSEQSDSSLDLPGGLPASSVGQAHPLTHQTVPSPRDLARGPVIVRVYASLLAGGSNTATVREELPEAGSGGCLRGALRFSMENVTRSGNTNAYADENAHKIVDGSHNVRFSHSHVVSR